MLYVLAKFKCFVSTKLLALLIFCLLISLPSYSQKKLAIKITKIPEYTPENETLYLATSIDNWILAKEENRFVKLADGGYYLELDLPNSKDFEFKVNRGDWNSVEGNDIGEYFSNRNFLFSADKFDIEIVVKSWQDLHKVFLPPVTIHLSNVPSNTPDNAKLYVAGSFNGWNFTDPDYELTKLDDGTYQAVIIAGLKSFEYKISRGSQGTVEGRWDGGVRSNRIFKASLKKEPTTIDLQIESWEDLSPARFWKMLLFLFLALQGLQILGLLVYFRYNNTLTALTGMSILSFLMISAYNNPELFNFFPHGYLLPACFYAFWGPWMYSWLLFSSKSRDYKIKEVRIAFALPFLSLLVMAQLIGISYSNFLDLSMVNKLNNYFLILYVYGLALNLVYGYKSYKYVKKNEETTANWVIKLFKAILVNWYASLLVGIIMSVAYLLNSEVKLLTEWTEKLFWLSIGIAIIYIEWVLIVKVADFIARANLKSNKDFSESENWDTFKKKLANLMENELLYADPKLTLSSLANNLGTNTYYASKILNEGFEKSFSDYINSYRIEAFIDTVKKDANHKKTYLSIAYNVGFNSKSAFNRAFKKHMNSTPSDFFNTI